MKLHNHKTFLEFLETVGAFAGMFWLLVLIFERALYE